MCSPPIRSGKKKQKKAFETPGPVIVGLHVDYSGNHKLFEMAKGDSITKLGPHGGKSDRS